MKIVSAAVIVKDGKIFIAQRPADKKPPLQWEFPGGKQEPGETIEQCLVREIKEELGADVRVGKFIMSSRFDYEWGSFELQAYFAELLPGSGIRPSEHKNYAWAAPEELGGYDFAAADLPIVRRLKELMI